MEDEGTRTKWKTFQEDEYSIHTLSFHLQTEKVTIHGNHTASVLKGQKQITYFNPITLISDKGTQVTTLFFSIPT